MVVGKESKYVISLSLTRTVCFAEVRVEGINRVLL